MATANDPVLAALAPIAASGTKNVIIQVPPNAQKLRVQLNAAYATAAGTSGVSAAFSVSQDNTGASYAASNVPTVTAAGVSGAMTQVNAVLGFQDIALRKDPLPVSFVKVVLTNLDATNVAATALTVKFD